MKKIPNIYYACPPTDTRHSQKSLSISTSGSVQSGSEVGSAVSSNAALTVSTYPNLRSFSDPDVDHGAHKKQSPWRKVMARMKGKSGKGGFRRQLSGRENPARPALSEDEGSPTDEPPNSPAFSAPALCRAQGPGGEGGVAAGRGAALTRPARKEQGAGPRVPAQPQMGRLGEQKKEARAKTIPQKQYYDDPGVALELSESNDDDDDNDDDDNDDTLEPIPIMTGRHVPWKESARGRVPANSFSQAGKLPSQAARPRSRDGDELNGLEAIEVVSTLAASPASFSSTAVRVLSPAPAPVLERMAGAAGSLEEGQASVQARQKNCSPLRNLPLPSGAPQLAISSTLHDSPNSKLSSSAGSPTSRVSSSNSRGTHLTTLSGGGRTVDTLHTEGSLVADGADSEVREANDRCPGRGRPGPGANAENVPGQEVLAALDGSDTVLSSSTTSSTYHAYLSSPRPLRDGATLPTDRFFAGGAGTLYPSPMRDHPPSTGLASAAPSISRIIALSPKKWSSRMHGGHSPHTVSSNSVSANSSCSSETKKPLKFVAYESQDDRESSPYCEPPLGGTVPPLRNSVIRPRISKGARPEPPPRRPPTTRGTTASCHSPRPPPSPRRGDPSGQTAAGARTPPPVAFPNSGANTPCSPPVIVDGPCGDMGTRPQRPSVVRRSSAAHGGGGRGMFLIPPGASYGPARHLPVPPQPSPLQGSLEVVGEGTNDGAQEIVLDATVVTAAVKTGGAGCIAVTVSPDRNINTARKLYTVHDPVPKEELVPDDAVVVSPDKGY